jgi:hypothetical protein
MDVRPEDHQSEDHQSEGQAPHDQLSEDQLSGADSRGRSSGLTGAEVQERMLFAAIAIFVLPFVTIAFFWASSFQRKVFFFYILFVSAALLLMAKCIVYSYNRDKKKIDESRDQDR